MEYKVRNLTSDPGMSQAEALVSLQTDPTFKQGSVIKTIRKRDTQWVAEVLEPKTAEFPPGEDEGGGSDLPPKEEKPKNDGPPSDEDEGDDSGSPDGPPGLPGEDGPPKDGKEGGKGGTEEQILHTLQQLLHAVQGGGGLPGEGMGGPDALGPDPLAGGGPPPPKGGPPGAGGPPGGPPGMGGPPKPKAQPPMKPGMTPPGGTPVGAPAFSHTHTANPGVMPGVGTPVPGAQQPGPVGPEAQGGVCPVDGNPEPCPIHSGAPAPGAPQGLNQMVASYSGRSATINLTNTDGVDIKTAVDEVRPVVENYGYKVKQAKYGDNGQIHILASRR